MSDDRFSTVDQAVAAIAAGECVVVVDDDDRENEGDLILAAARATPERVALMIRHTSGIICAPLPAAEAQRLHLTPMVAVNDAPMGTAFTVSVDYRPGLTTGISAEERCNTVRALANPNAGAADFARPGHVFPLIARDGGVLMRSGHTEAAVDLAQLAGLPPIGVIGELVNDDGTVKHGPEVMAFAAEHGLKVVSVDQLIAYRQARETLVTRVAEGPVSTKFGPARTVSYATPFDDVHHLALVFGELGAGRDVPVRFHAEDVLADVFGTQTLLAATVERFHAHGQGVLIYLREGAAGVAPTARALPVTAPTDGATEVPPPRHTTRQRHWREVGLGAQILRDLGVQSIHLLATRARQYVGLPGFGLTITKTEILLV